MLGQMALCCADLFFNQIEVIEQPFTRWRDPVVRLYRRRQLVVKVDKKMLVYLQPRQKLLSMVFRSQFVRGG